jgi:deoxycytidylate deaminase
MALSCLVAQTAEKIDEKRRVGSCVLSEDGQVLSFGYNHMPDKSDDYNWEDKHNYVFHAEMDALKQTTKSEIWTHRASLYTTLHPCSMCARYIVLMGLQRVVFYSDWKIGKESFKAKEARKILADSKFKQYPKEVGSVEKWPAKLNFDHLKSESTSHDDGPSTSSQWVYYINYVIIECNLFHFAPTSLTILLLSNITVTLYSDNLHVHIHI